jgi:hypothetical protein
VVAAAACMAVRQISRVDDVWAGDGWNCEADVAPLVSADRMQMSASTRSWLTVPPVLEHAVRRLLKHAWTCDRWGGREWGKTAQRKRPLRGCGGWAAQGKLKGLLGGAEVHWAMQLCSFAEKLLVCRSTGRSEPRVGAPLKLLLRPEYKDHVWYNCSVTSIHVMP